MRQILVPTEAVLSVVLGMPFGNIQEAYDLCQQLLRVPTDATSFAADAVRATPLVEEAVPWVRGFNADTIDLSDPTKWVGLMNALHGDKQWIWVADEPTATPIPAKLP